MMNAGVIAARAAAWNIFVPGKDLKRAEVREVKRLQRWEKIPVGRLALHDYRLQSRRDVTATSLPRYRRRVRLSKP